MNNEDIYEKAYDVICKKAQGKLVLPKKHMLIDGYTNKPFIALENKWTTLQVILLKDGVEREFDDFAIAIEDNRLSNKVRIAKSLLNYAKTYDIAYGIFEPQVFLKRGTTLEQIFIEADLMELQQ